MSRRAVPLNEFGMALKALGEKLLDTFEPVIKTIYRGAFPFLFDRKLGPSPAVMDIVAQYLVRYGYDGLVNPEAECSCPLDDLIPCEWMNERDCHAGYKVDCGGCEEYLQCLSVKRTSECSRLDDE